MKISIYELLGLIKDSKAPKKIKITENIYEYDDLLKFYYTKKDDFRRIILGGVNNEINLIANAFNENLVEILEEEKKFTKEDFIKEMIEFEGITRKQFDKKYKVEECNCGMWFCKGFIASPRREKKIPEKLETLKHSCNFDRYEETLYENQIDLANKITEILDYLKIKGE